MKLYQDNEPETDDILHPRGLIIHWYSHAVKKGVKLKPKFIHNSFPRRIRFLPLQYTYIKQEKKGKQSWQKATTYWWEVHMWSANVINGLNLADMSGLDDECWPIHNGTAWYGVHTLLLGDKKAKLIFPDAVFNRDSHGTEERGWWTNCLQSLHDFEFM